jgi:hypothetical protein
MQSAGISPPSKVSRSRSCARASRTCSYYEVTRAISGEWQTFVHVDGYQRRYNGDHDTLEGKYAFHLWRPGDFVADVHQIELEPNFTAGTYTMYFGLFRGEQRLEVKRGAGDDNRVNAGPIEVR